MVILSFPKLLTQKGCCCISLVTVIILVAVSFSSVEVNEYALKYCSITKTVYSYILLITKKIDKYTGIHSRYISYRSWTSLHQISEECSNN